MKLRNLFEDSAAPAIGERFETWLRHPDVCIERIVSSAQPEADVYDQSHDEWLCLLQGEAVMDVAGETVHLIPGDTLHLPAHSPHRVLSTSRDPCCIWLTVHFGAVDKRDLQQS